MAKKSVPDWLNNSLWSSPSDPSTEDRLRRFGSNSPAAAPADEFSIASPVSQAPSPPPPLPAVVRPEPPSPKSQSPKSSDSQDDVDHANGASTSSALSPDDLSRQAQLLVEVDFFLFYASLWFSFRYCTQNRVLELDFSCRRM